MLNRVHLQCGIKTCVTERREHPRARIAVTGQELSLSSSKRERGVFKHWRRGGVSIDKVLWRWKAEVEVVRKEGVLH